MDDENLLDPDDEQGQSTEEQLEEDIADDIDLELDGDEGSPRGLRPGVEAEPGLSREHAAAATPPCRSS